MKKLLILGGTRFVGKKLLFKIGKSQDELKVFVASRRRIDTDNFFYIDRKNPQDLKEIFFKHRFDIVLDFINFSSTDSENLISVIKNSGQNPHLIVISSIYVYTRPEDLVKDSCFSEEDFDPKNYVSDSKDLIKPDYTEGKRTAEAYLSQNYPQNKLTIIRFPVILGHDDYTKRTFFFEEIITKNGKLQLSERGGKANYLFSEEAADAILYFIRNCITGIYNVVMQPALNEHEIFLLYCLFHGNNPNKYLDDNVDMVYSPFFYKNNFITDGSKFEKLFSFETKFKEAFFRELEKI